MRSVAACALPASNRAANQVAIPYRMFTFLKVVLPMSPRILDHFIGAGEQ